MAVRPRKGGMNVIPGADEGVYRLIELVQQQQALWDKNSAEFRKGRREKALIWIDVARELSADMGHDVSG